MASVNHSADRNGLARVRLVVAMRAVAFAGAVIAATLLGVDTAFGQLPGQSPSQLTAPALAPAQEVAPESAPATAASIDPLAMLPPEEARQVLQWAVDWVSRTLPESYHNDKGWGKKTRVYTGVKLTKHDGKPSTKRQWKELGHGRWVRYDVHLRDPNDPGRLAIRITRAELGEDRRIHFEAQIDTLLDVEVHQERWNLGTRLWSISVLAQASLRMVVAGDIGFEFDLTRVPPDVLVDPHIASTQLTLVNLKVDRVSKIGGEVAEAVGDIAEKIIRDEYLPKQQAKITDRLNGQIDRRRDRLRLSASDWLMRSLPAGITQSQTPPSD